MKCERKPEKEKKGNEERKPEKEEKVNDTRRGNWKRRRGERKQELGMRGKDA